MSKAVLKKSKARYKTSIPTKEIRNATKELSSGAFKLLIYYYGIEDGWYFIDKYTANSLDISERQLRLYRNELIKKEYLLIQKGEVDVYFVGQWAVERFNTELFDVIDEEYPGYENDKNTTN
jgi:hypothetical protein